MNESPGILIIGGGVAGMSAALALARRQVKVHLVESRPHLGGHAGDWACMATDACQNCGACLAGEMAARAEAADNIAIRLNSEIAALDRTETGFKARLSSGEILTADKAVLATGFTPFDPARLPSYHTKALDRVITTARLNTLLREQKLSKMVTGRSPKIAFLQCVGSRDRENNRDYCSQVCCKISMRHAQKIRHLIPEADISLFYMDLQIMGKEIRPLASRLSKEIRFIQGVPAEILENPETRQLTMVTEDPATGSRQASSFDLVVLSVGMVPGEKTRGICRSLGTAPNPWGFFNTPEADPGANIHVIGCAQGPKDILSAVQDGRTAAVQILKEMNLSARLDKKIALLGSGPAAQALARAMAKNGYKVSVFGRVSRLPDGAGDLGTARILSINGTENNFSILYRDRDRTKQLSCAAIIAAPGPRRLPGNKEIPPALSLAEFAAVEPEKKPDNSLILLDYYGPESKEGGRTALIAALKTQAAGRQVDVLMNKILVNGPRGQQLYDRARKLGVRFLRYNSPSDLKIQSHNKKINITLKEATLPGLELELRPDLLVVPDTRAADKKFTGLAKLLGLDLDLEGFLQPANVRHRPVRSLRKGIYLAGPGHDDIDETDLKFEIHAILADLENRAEPKGRVSINKDHCAKCLTCYRVCPHRAIIIDDQQCPVIVSQACFDCQACVSNCPAHAIESGGLSNRDLAGPAQKGRTLVFACQRSAGLAARTLPGDTDLVSIPCACRISPDMLLKALVKGADRVIVSGCHQGNCRSGRGGAIARQGVEAVSAMPGIPRGKVAWQAVAANEPGILGNTLAKASKGENI